jgi:hypothetical protein
MNKRQHIAKTGALASKPVLFNKRTEINKINDSNFIYLPRRTTGNTDWWRSIHLCK